MHKYQLPSVGGKPVVYNYLNPSTILPKSVKQDTIQITTLAMTGFLYLEKGYFKYGKIDKLSLPEVKNSSVFVSKVLIVGDDLKEKPTIQGDVGDSC